MQKKLFKKPDRKRYCSLCGERLEEPRTEKEKQQMKEEFEKEFPQMKSSKIWAVLVGILILISWISTIAYVWIGIYVIRYFGNIEDDWWSIFLFIPLVCALIYYSKKFADSLKSEIEDNNQIKQKEAESS